MNLFHRLFRRPKEPVEPPPEFLQPAPPDWLIDLKGQIFPSGNRFSIRVQLFETARTGSADILILPVSSTGEAQSATVNLDRTEIDHLLVILGFSFPQDMAAVAGETGAGLPVTMKIFHQEPLAEKTADCNLAEWLDSKKSAPPVVEIGKILVELQRRAIPPPPI